MPAKPSIAEGAGPNGHPDEGWIWRRVCAAAQDVAADLRSRGLCAVAPNASSRQSFNLVARRLRVVPALEAELARLVHEVMVLEADPGFDVSHSEPRWPTAIFVSVPPATDRYAELRLFENVVHEGMHLRLTEIEDLSPLVQAGAGPIFSPWKREDRDAQRVLHGLYVFVCIATLFATPQLLASLDDGGRAYASRRISEIRLELEDLNFVSLEHSLNDNGRRFLRSLLSPAPDELPWTLRSP